MLWQLHHDQPGCKPKGGMGMGELKDRVAAATRQRAEREAQQAESQKRAEREAQQAESQMWLKYTALATVAAVIVALAVGILNGFGLRDQEQATAKQEQATAQQIKDQEQAIKDQEQASAQQDQESRYSSVSQLSLDLDKTIADHPRLITCFQYTDCNAQPALTPDEIKQARALASYIVDFYQYLYDQLDSLGQVPDSGLFTLRHDAIPGVSKEAWVTWSETIFNGFKYSTMVCTALKEGAGAYEQRFVHAVAVTHACPKLPDPGPSPYR
jgi:hypothetical protein